MILEKELIETLKILDSYLRNKNIPYILIGAQVPKILFSLNRSEKEYRPTKDLDLSIKCHGWNDYEALVNDLEQMGFSRKESRPEHTLFYKNTIIDLIPYIENNIVKEHITFPETNNVFNMKGFDKLFNNAIKKKINNKLYVQTVPLHLLVYSKIIAFLDRAKSKNNYDDLKDILYIFRNYDDVENSERRFEIDPKFNIKYEQRGAFLVGADLKKILQNEEKEEVIKFLNLFKDEYSYPIQKTSSPNKNESKETYKLIVAFREGINL
ncbi:MAG: hypothetical protein KGY74_08790 [Candidatus Cloacimonetes bacterium]|nr:hypothetical protein [Candidatus Cloacimonadota bacterium]